MNLLELQLKFGLYGIICETDLKLGLYNVYYLSSIVCVCTSLLYKIPGTEDSFDFLMNWNYVSSDLVWASL